VIEGPTLIAEATEAGVHIDVVYATDAAEVPHNVDQRLIRFVSAGVLSRVLDTTTPQEVAAVAVPVERGVTAVLDVAIAAGRPILVLDGLADPGNVGTLLRSAEASGAAGVIATAGTVDLWSPKVTRSAAGASFRVPLATGASLTDIVGAIPTVALALDGEVTHLDADLGGAVGIVVGNEARGLSPESAARCDHRVRIVMDGPTESLNAAMAGTVVCFEALRQRRRSPST